MRSLSKTEMSLLNMIAEEVDSLLKSKSSPSTATLGPLTRMLTRHLPYLTGGKKVSVVWDTNPKATPYIMAMYVDPDDLSKASAELFDIALSRDKGNASEYLDRWNGIKNWELYIETRIVDPKSVFCVDNGRQFAAVLCHEIGHVQYGDPLSLVLSYRENCEMFSKMERMMLSKNRLVRKVALPVFVGTMSFRVIANKPNANADEIAADAYVPEELKGELAAYLDKIRQTASVNQFIMSPAEYKAKQKTAVKFSKETLDMLKRRRNILRNQIKAQCMDDSNDPYVKRLLHKVEQGVLKFGKDDEVSPVDEAALVDMLDRETKYCMETYSAMLESENVTERKLTMLELDIEAIKNTDDKLWCIQTIYDYIDAINTENRKKIKALHNKKITDIPESLLKDPRLDRLMAMRKEVMAKQVDDVAKTQYGIYINYPKGYEG